MLIGKLAVITGVSRKAIRHYEEIGLIPRPHRKGTYREYSEDYIPIIELIKKAQFVGFSLSELREVVSKKAECGEFPIKLACELISKKLLETSLEIERLKQLSVNLEELRINLMNTFEIP